MIGISTSVFANSNTKLEDALSILEDKTRYAELICDGYLNVMENTEVPLSFDLKYTLHCPLSDMNLSSFREKVRKTSVEVVEDILKVADEVDASLSGSGDINLSGRTTDFTVSVSGSGDIKAYDLEADFVRATVSGSADIRVTANQSIDARVSGSGDIHYRGNPKKIKSKASGSGDITKG